MQNNHQSSRLASALSAARKPAPEPAEAPAPAPLISALRDYQEDFVQQVRVEYRGGIQSVLLVAATGAGKTVVFSYIAKASAAKGSRVLILAHRDQLIKQASRKLSENGVMHGIIMAGFTPNPRRLVQVASVQTLVRRVEKMIAAGITFDLIVIDEAHLSAAASYMKILAAWPKARVLGVTGSPIRLDGKGLGRGQGGCFDSLVQGISIRQLIDQGYLVRPTVYASKTQVDLSSVKKVGGDFDNAALADVMDKPVITGSAIAEYKRICPGVPAVAWCANVAHAKHVAEQFNASGIPALALSGEDDSAARDRALAGLSNGSLKVITFAMLLVEGVDCPAIGAVILLRPTMSLSSYLQTIGRGLRPIYATGMPLDTTEQRMAAIDAGPKGRRCFVLDHAGLTFRHGLADEEREWSLDGVTKKKGKKKDAEKPVPLAQCPKCYLVHDPAPACPACGHVYEAKVRNLNEVDGELAEITPEVAEQLRRKRNGEVSGARTLEDLQKVAAQRGYKPSWARMVFEARQRKKSGASRPY
jgi:DNA repair protein RadD